MRKPFFDSPNLSLILKKYIDMKTEEKPKTVKIPQRFYDDSHECETHPPKIIKENSKSYWIESERNRSMYEFINRALYYVHPFGIRGGHYGNYVRAAGSLLKALHKGDVLTEEEREEAISSGVKLS